MPFLPSLPRRFRKNLRTQKNSTPHTTNIMPMKIATTPHFGIFVISAVLTTTLLIVLSTDLMNDVFAVVDAASASFVTASSDAENKECGGTGKILQLHRFVGNKWNSWESNVSLTRSFCCISAMVMLMTKNMWFVILRRGFKSFSLSLVHLPTIRHDSVLISRLYYDGKGNMADQ